MHLSFLSDGYFSDSIADAPFGTTVETAAFGKAHFDGLIRGGLFLLALVVPLALTVALSPAQTTAADPVPATHIRITHLKMP